MQDNDIVVLPRPDGRFILRRWRESEGVVEMEIIPGHEDAYEKAEMLPRVEKLRPTGRPYLYSESGELTAL